MGNALLNIVFIAWVLAGAFEGTFARPDCGRHLNFKVGVYDPQGTSESSKYRPSRKPEDQDRYVRRKPALAMRWPSGGVSSFTDQSCPFHSSPATVLSLLVLERQLRSFGTRELPRSLVTYL